MAVVANTTELLHLEAEIGFFAPDDLAVHTLADWETLTYDRVSPHPDIVSQRIRTLHALPTLSRGILLLTAPALMQRLPPRSFLDRHSLLVSRGDTFRARRLPRAPGRGPATATSARSRSTASSPCAARSSTSTR